MSLAGEIRNEIENIKELKITVGDINNHLSVLEGLTRKDIEEREKEAYQRGINDGSLDVKQRVEGAYQRGLEDAWEAARKLFSSMADSDIEVAFPIEWNNGGFKALMNLQPQEAIAKLKAYEDKQKDDDHIEVGDEVINNTTGTKGILLEPETEDLLATVVVPNHRWNTFNMSHINLTKTGRHFDIEGILEAMKQE